LGDILYAKISFYKIGEMMKGKIITVLDAVAYWALVFFPFSMAIAPAFTSILMGFLFFSFITKKVLKRERLCVKTAIDTPFLFMVIIAVISIYNSVDYSSSIRGMFKLVNSALLYLVFVEEIRDRLHVKRIVIAMLAGASLASFDALWQMSFGKDFIRGFMPKIAIGLTRATAAFPNPNVLGIYLAPLASLAFGLGLFYFKGAKRIAMIIVGLLIATGLLLTFSRFAGLGFFLGVFFMAIVRRNKIIVSLLILALLIFSFGAPKNIKGWAKEAKNPVIFMFNADRISIYKNSLNMIKHHPFIGVGVNTFCENYLKYKLPEPKGAESADHVYAHNNFLQMAGDIGLLGLGAFIWLLIALFTYFGRLYKKMRDNYYKVLLLSLIASIIVFLVNGMAETNLYYARVASLFWYLVGFSLALQKIEKQV